MAQQTINTGTSELAGDGESIRSAFGKVNENFDEVYSDIAGLDGSKIVYGDLSVTTASASGAGALSYDSSTGTFTFTPAASGFDGDYNSLTNKPTIPTVPTALSGFTNDSGYITGYTVTESDVTAHQAALSITESQISDLSHFSGDYNDLTNKPTIPTVPTAVSAFTNDSGYITGYTVTESDVTAHQSALSITESQISDLQSYLTSYTVTESDVTTHQAALSITESQISDFGTYATTAAIGNSGNWDTAYSWGDHSTAGYQLASSAAGSISIISTTGTDQEFPLLFVTGVGNNTPRVDATKLTFNPSSDTLSINSATVSSTKISNWDTAYGWGDHSTAGYVESDTTGITGADAVTNMVSLTQAEYDAIGTPNASTVYIIVG